MPQQRNLALICLIAVFLLYPFYNLLSPQVWNYYGGTLAHFLPGIATLGEFTETYIYGAYKFNLLFVWLHKIMPLIPWVAIIFQLISLACYTATLWMIISPDKLFSKDSKNIGYIKMVAFFILLYPSISRVGITANSFLLATTSLLLCNCLIQNKQFNLKWLLKYIGCMAIYVFAFINVIEPAIAATLIVLGYLFLYTKQHAKTFLLLIPLMLVGTLTSYVIISSLDSIPLLKHTEKAMYFIGDGALNNSTYNKGLSEKEQIKLQALQTFFLSDEEELNEKFIFNMYALKLENETQLKVNVLNKIENTFQVLSEPIRLNSIQLITLAVWLIFLFIYQKKYRLKILVFTLGFLFMVLALAYGLKLDDRHLIYLIQVFGICALLHSITQQTPIKTFPILVAIVAFLFTAQIVIAAINGVEVRKKIHLQSLAVKEFLAMTKDKIVVMDSYSIAIYWGSVYHIVDLREIDKIVYYDFGQMPIIPEYKEILDKACHCNSRNPVAFYGWLQKNSKNVLIVSTDQRTAFIEKYMQVIKSYKIKFLKNDGNFTINKIKGEGQNLNYYTII